MYDFLSISSMADKYMINKGCYDDVVQLSGPCREFIQKTIVGGRVMTAKNKRYLIEGQDMLDADANSLYPTAMSFSKYPTGIPKHFKDGQVPTDASVIYFARVEFVKQPSYELDFPLISYIDDNGGRRFSNDLKGRVLHVDSITLSEYIEH